MERGPATVIILLALIVLTIAFLSLLSVIWNERVNNVRILHFWQATNIVAR